MQKMSNTKFKEYVEKKVRSTIRKYTLFNQKDKILVAVSGGKDSTVCLYILKKLGYDIEAITIDAQIGNYTKQNLENIKTVCKTYEVPLHVISFREEFGFSLCYIRSHLKSKGYNYSSCMICGVLKRYLLNKYAKELKANCLATGHNLDDEAQTTLMNVFRNDFQRSERQGAKPGLIKTAHFVQRVKPLYLISEEEAKKYSQLMEFPVNYDICPCSVAAYRRQFIKILNEFEEKHPSVKYNIVKFNESMQSNLKEKEEQVIEACESCGEPSNNILCKACVIINEMKNKEDIKPVSQPSQI